jgi:metal-responsive CopG/Arc/MetJ family transcriptional regulator
MKPIQIMVDPELLSDLDATEEVRREGRSAVFRRAISEYLERRRRQQIRDQYRRAYGTGAALGNDFEGWEEQGSWPDE